jgi:hypothetical protein
MSYKTLSNKDVSNKKLTVGTVNIYMYVCMLRGELMYRMIEKDGRDLKPL